jgi:hypothetical protein
VLGGCSLKLVNTRRLVCKHDTCRISRSLGLVVSAPFEEEEEEELVVLMKRTGGFN